jgi:hypothetical protein
MTFDEIDRLVRAANPVPHPSQLDSASPTTGESHEPWRTTMQIQDLSDTTSIQRRAGQRPRVPILTGVAAALLVVVALVAFSVVGGDDDGTAPPAATAASPVDLADSFLTAWAAGDARQAASYLAPDALTESGGVDGLRQELRWREASGWQWFFDPCETVGGGTDRTILRCGFSYHGVRSNELGLPPFEGSDYRIVVGSEGQITSFTENIEFEANDFNDRIWEPFYEWVSANHPDDLAVMYTDATGSAFGDSDESIALWERRSREYVRAMTEG